MNWGNIQVCRLGAENNPTTPQHPHQLIPDRSLYLEAKALSMSVAAIRKARGKMNPHDVAVDSPDWYQAYREFADDVLAALIANDFS